MYGSRPSPASSLCHHSVCPPRSLALLLACSLLLAFSPIQSCRLHLHPTPPPPRPAPQQQPPHPPGSASDATQALEALPGTPDGDGGVKDASPPTTTTNVSTAAAAANTAANATSTAETVAREEAIEAVDAALEPFRGVQGMGPAMLTSLLGFARADSGNRPVVEALASEVRFAAPAERRRRRRRRRQSGVDGGGKGTASGWVEGKTVVFTGSLTRYMGEFLWRGVVVEASNP